LNGGVKILSKCLINALRILNCRFFTDFTVIFSLPQLQIQLAALEENPGAVVGEVLEASGVGLDELALEPARL
jgi:hypothetical protein